MKSTRPAHVKIGLMWAFEAFSLQKQGRSLTLRVTDVTDRANHVWTFTRDAAGRLTALSYLLNYSSMSCCFHRKDILMKYS